ncbi:hypothetical protein [Orlajensenia leifsoniae]|uniref:Uncharacterized protein n=1 Tax=Orlajensenia leifsoniae TaxID=2561933 RepID=A0A4Y9R556_9MICO|nr:hypothetical protein [Leifsonia flava]TFV99774.1 hypothetical protein E4M00_00770 [Leifsonia flava]
MDEANQEQHTTPQPARIPPRARAHRIAAGMEDRHPTWLVEHALAAGWIWAAFWVALLFVADHFDLHAVIWVVLVVIAVLPSFAATIVVLSQTPRSHLERPESVLAHFFGRFAGYTFAFLAWTISVVLSATIAAQLQNAGKDNETATLGIGAGWVLAAVPVVVLFLWLVLTFRYAWYLSRLRGWRAHPKRTRLPKGFLEGMPRTHALVVGLAHPGLLAVTGSLAVLLAAGLWVDDVTIHII